MIDRQTDQHSIDVYFLGIIYNCLFCNVDSRTYVCVLAAVVYCVFPVGGLHQYPV